MNTFHSTLVNDNRNFNTALLYLQELYQNDINIQISLNDTNNYLIDLIDILWYRNQLTDIIRGYCVKLSVLENLEITIQEIFKYSTGDIIIDAEYDRLDKWLQSKIQSKELNVYNLNRLRLTIQVRRDDAADQLSNLEKYIQYGLKVVLVAGHKSYLEKYNGNMLVAKDQFLRFLHNKLVGIIGCGRKMWSKLQQYHDLSEIEILELQGYQSCNNNSLWTYYAGHQLSDEARKYLQRRGNHNHEYISRDMQSLLKLGTKHELFVFIDASSRLEYFLKLLSLSKSS